tara:strand:- start:177 stop:356 length:180 start_codon:yes stop_codon:yes gene_type:complete
MELIQKNIDHSHDIDNENLLHKETNERLSYLYPDGHRITPQMRWFKGSRERGLRSDIAA